MDEAGKRLCTEKVTLLYNDVFYFDVGAALKRAGFRNDTPHYVTAVGRGGASMFSILTFIHNSCTGSTAIEHTKNAPMLGSISEASASGSR